MDLLGSYHGPFAVIGRTCYDVDLDGVVCCPGSSVSTEARVEASNISCSNDGIVDK